MRLVGIRCVVDDNHVVCVIDCLASFVNQATYEVLCKHGSSLTFDVGNAPLILVDENTGYEWYR